MINYRIKNAEYTDVICFKSETKLNIEPNMVIRFDNVIEVGDATYKIKRVREVCESYSYDSRTIFTENTIYIEVVGVIAGHSINNIHIPYYVVDNTMTKK